VHSEIFVRELQESEKFLGLVRDMEPWIIWKINKKVECTVL